MKIGLVDVDSHNFPNLALMKISSYYKNLGEQVEFASCFDKYDIVYQSKIFTFTPDYNYYMQTDKLFKGGTGYDLDNKLPEEIETSYPDYTLYPQYKEAYGYLTRGCPRKCPFCIVDKKEGSKSYKVADLNNFWNGQKEIKLLDPNLLACKDRIELLNQLIESRSYVDFTQGLDARLLDEHVSELINKIKIKMIHFAWDTDKDSDLIIKKLTYFKTITKIRSRELRVYVLVNYNTTHEFDLYRIYKLVELGYDPFIMIYDKINAPKLTKQMSRWVNNKFVFRSCKKFEDYNKK